MNYCNCGNVAGPFIRGKYLCWECWNGLEAAEEIKKAKLINHAVQERPPGNYCDCGNPAAPVINGKHVCWECWKKFNHTVQVQPPSSIHIDFDSTVSGGRVQLCTDEAQQADPVNHPTPEIAAALLAQHPTKDKEFCELCLHLLRMYWPEEIAKAKAYAATLK